ncbi:MAG TPA: toll/interleukin-1 receptor domain-containing protein [Bacteroidia bacterium]|nr:toll/interleukin-1 receptor domain-containing protein [Bacteroidia bacterium]
MSKKIFISYSWGNDEHQEWVVNLSTKLMNDTVDVVLDRWSLKDGHDIYSFMEEMVKSGDIFRVLILSDKKYSEKADGREGGVGTETQIITPNIYSKEKQEKFIPIVLERDENGEPFLPIYLKSRKYIDFSRIESYEDSYEELLRNILEVPSLPKPKLGTTPPAYITENVINLSETNNKLKVIENQLKKNNKISNKELTNFLDLFLENLWAFDEPNTPSDLKLYGEQLFNILKSYKPLREDYLKFVDIISSYEIENTEEILIEFLENAPKFNSPRENSSSWSPARFEVFKIIFHEIFIYTIAICLKNKNYKLVADLLYTKYYKKDEYKKSTPESFSFLYNYNQNLENYSRTFFRKITGFGEYMITNLSTNFKKEDIILADTLCYFVSCLNKNNVRDTWFPNTYLYGKSTDFLFFEKITSEKYFEKIKVLFNINTKLELQEKLILEKENSKERISYGNGGYIPFAYELINPDTIAIYR